MSTQSESDVSLEDLRLPQLVSPRWSDDESVDSLQQPASPPHIDRSANSDAGCIILLNVLMELKALIIIIKYKQEIRSVELRICPMQLFNFWLRDIHPVQNLPLCTKFYENLVIFHRYMVIYHFSKYQPSAIFELFYHHTRPPTKSLLLAAAACQISCQSDTQIWRYSYLNFFAYLAWNAYSGPQNRGFWGTLDCWMWLFIIETPKRHILA